MIGNVAHTKSKRKPIALVPLNAVPVDEPALLQLRDVKYRVGLSTSSIYERVKAGTFPKPIRLDTRSVRWDARKVRAWIEQRIAEDAKR
jgi:prophage regulatory protein